MSAKEEQTDAFTEVEVQRDELVLIILALKADEINHTIAHRPRPDLPTNSLPIPPLFQMRPIRCFQVGQKAFLGQDESSVHITEVSYLKST